MNDSKSPEQVKCGDTFLLFDDENPSEKAHLHLVITDPDERGQCVLVSITTRRAKSDTMVCLDAGESSFITLPSVITYAYSKFSPCRKLGSGSLGGECIPKGRPMQRLSLDGPTVELLETDRAPREGQGLFFVSLHRASDIFLFSAAPHVPETRFVSGAPDSPAPKRASLLFSRPGPLISANLGIHEKKTMRPLGILTQDSSNCLSDILLADTSVGIIHDHLPVTLRHFYLQVSPPFLLLFIAYYSLVAESGWLSVAYDLVYVYLWPLVILWKLVKTDECQGISFAKKRTVGCAQGMIVPPTKAAQTRDESGRGGEG